MRVLATYLQDNQLAWQMLPDGNYERVQPQPGEELLNSQAIFMEDSCGVQSMP